jgi:hypothetical protein
MKFNLEILPKPQLQLWYMLKGIPKHFILYGGTAVALHLGHRKSIDFDFFSQKPLNRNELIDALPFLRQAHWVQPEINTLNCTIRMTDGEVNLQFLADLGNRQGQIEDPIRCPDNGVYIASLRDLLATKLNTIQLRAAVKDYVDIDAMLQSGLTLEDGLACACKMYGQSFDPGTSLRALCSYRDGDLLQLPDKIKQRLTDAALKIDEI